MRRRRDWRDSCRSEAQSSYRDKATARCMTHVMWRGLSKYKRNQYLMVLLCLSFS